MHTCEPSRMTRLNLSTKSKLNQALCFSNTKTRRGYLYGSRAAAPPFVVPTLFFFFLFFALGTDFCSVRCRDNTLRNTKRSEPVNGSQTSIGLCRVFFGRGSVIIRQWSLNVRELGRTNRALVLQVDLPNSSLGVRCCALQYSKIWLHFRPVESACTV